MSSRATGALWELLCWVSAPFSPRRSLRGPLLSSFFFACSSACSFRISSCWAIWSSRLVKDGMDFGALSRTRLRSSSSLRRFSSARRSSSAFLRAASSAARRLSSSARSFSRRFSAAMRSFSALAASSRSFSAFASASARFCASISAARASRIGFSFLRTMET